MLHVLPVNGMRLIRGESIVHLLSVVVFFSLNILEFCSTVMIILDCGACPRVISSAFSVGHPSGIVVFLVE